MNNRPSISGPAAGLVTAILAITAAPSAGVAQIATDRPDFVESSATVGAGALQVETSAAYQRSGSAAARQAAWTTPTLVRIGVGADVELRIEGDGWVRDASAPGLRSEDGLADVALGLKWHTSDAADGRPATALLLHADLPSGSSPHRGDGIRPSLRAVAEWTLPWGLSLGVMPGLLADRTTEQVFVAAVLGAVVGLEVTERVRAFAELSYPQIAAPEHGGTQGSFNTGLAFLLSPTIQFDSGLSWGVTDGAPDFGLTIGLSVLRSGN